MWNGKPTSRGYSSTLNLSDTMTDIKTCVVADDEVTKNHLIDLASAFKEIDIVSQPSNGTQAVIEIESQQPDLIFIDVTLRDMNGFDLPAKIKLIEKPIIVFVSDDQKDALHAFDSFANDFLMKPISRQRFNLMMIKVKEVISNRQADHLQDNLNALFRYIKVGSSQEKAKTPESDLIPIKLSGRIYFIHTNDIEYISASGYYIEIFAKGKKHLVRQSLNSMAEKLNADQFVRIHRSVVINLQYLQEISRNGTNDFSVKMMSGPEFKISKSYKQAFFDRFGI